MFLDIANRGHLFTVLTEGRSLAYLSRAYCLLVLQAGRGFLRKLVE